MVCLCNIVVKLLKSLGILKGLKPPVEPSVAHQAGADPGFCGIKRLEVEARSISSSCMQFALRRREKPWERGKVYL